MENPYESPKTDMLLPPDPMPEEDLIETDLPEGWPEDWDESMTELCVCCVRPHYPDDLFCHRCGAPVHGLATLLPFERIFAEGFVMRRAAENPPSRFVVFCLFLIGIGSGHILYTLIAFRSLGSSRLRKTVGDRPT